MKRLAKTMKEWLKERTEATACKREARKERMLSRASERAVQLMEYEGDLYVSHNGEPLLPIDCLKWGLPPHVRRDAWNMEGVAQRKRSRVWKLLRVTVVSTRR